MRLMTNPTKDDQKVRSIRDVNSWFYFFIPASILAFSIIPQFATWAPDDIYMATLPDPDRFAEQAFIFASRPLGAALFWVAALLHLNIIQDGYLFAAFYAISFAWFFSTAIFWISDWSPHPLTIGAGAALVCLYGFQIDFNQFTHQYVVVSLMYLLMGAFLQVFSRTTQRSPRIFLFVVIGFLANLCYQAATMGLAMLLAGRMLKMTAENRSAGQASSNDRVKTFDGLLGIFLSCVLYFILTKIMYRLGVPTLRPPVHISVQWLIHRSYEYSDAIFALLTPVGGPYGAQNDLGFTIWGLIAIPLLSNIYKTRRFSSFALSIFLVLVIVILAQNPENIFLRTYWPAPRASFYAGFVSPILLVAAFSSFEGTTGMSRASWKFLEWVTLFSVILELSATSYIVIDHIHTYGQDVALAREISWKIMEDPELAKLTHIQFPPSSWNPRKGYFLGGEPPSYDYGSLFAAPWSANALIEMASGLKLTISGTSICPAGPRTIWTLAVKQEGKSIAVCF